MAQQEQVIEGAQEREAELTTTRAELRSLKQQLAEAQLAQSTALNSQVCTKQNTAVC